MDRRIYGLENEYGVTCTLRGQRRLSPDEVARYLFRRVVSWGRSSNVFLANGARLYLDVGSHPEYASPECGSLYDLVAASIDEFGGNVALEFFGKTTTYEQMGEQIDRHGIHDERGHGRLDRDAAPPLLIQGIGLRIAAVNAADLFNDAGCVEQSFGEACLTGVYVRQDPQV